MSAQLYNPEAKKLVNVGAGQIKTLLAAGWLKPGYVDKKTPVVEAKKSAPVKKG